MSNPSLPMCEILLSRASEMNIRTDRLSHDTDGALIPSCGCRSMLYALNSAILLHTSAQQYDAAWQIYRRMCTVGPKPNTVTINTLLAACADAGRLSQAMKLFDELRSRGIRLAQASVRHQLWLVCGVVQCSTVHVPGHLDICCRSAAFRVHLRLSAARRCA